MNASPMLLECRELMRPGAAEAPALLQAVNLELREGDRHALVGKSGSGKSLLLRGLAFLDRRAQGTIKFRDQEVTALGVPQFRRHVLYLTQHSTLLPVSVEDNLRLPFQLAVRRGESFDREAIVRQLAALGRTASFLDKPITELSGGEARLVALLRALQLEADVLLLDEPTSSLDEESGRVVERMVDDWLAARPQRAWLWVTHSLEQARRVATRVWEMDRGQISELS